MKRIGYFNWLMHDKEVIVPMTITLGFHLAVIFWGLLTLNFILGQAGIGWILFFGALFCFSTYKLINFYRLGGWKNMKGRSINSFVYNNKFKKVK